MVNHTMGKRLNQLAIFFTLFTLFIYTLGFLGITQTILPGAGAIYLQYGSLAIAILLTVLGRGKELSKLSLRILLIGIGVLVLLYLVLIPILWTLSGTP
ncbi:hypothetical protein [Bacillus cereus]|uniref:hypothetical protein n=1 Tax=Bacillus cereus TaxID=1396 RepID=UPI00124CD613|nr:hypothetical protein [Bacillus cereus]KAB2477775.1 hypothetical protein F8159_17560 [Bacillus cereus]